MTTLAGASAASAGAGGVLGLSIKAIPSLTSKGASDPSADVDIYDICTTVFIPDTVRVPTNLIFVIDVSGSMGEVATPADATGASKESGTNLTNLDIVKHAIRAAARIANMDDSIALIKFNNRASIELPLTKMDEAGQAAVEKKLNEMMHGGSTNIWDGLHMGLEVAKRSRAASSVSLANANYSILLLTDGVPNINPSAGILPSLASYRDSMGTGDSILPATITTFGFGYNLESKLLEDIAVHSGGLYSFIPDASFCGTAFINSIANILCSQIKDLNINFTTKPGATLLPDYFDHDARDIRTVTGGVGVVSKMHRAHIQTGQTFSFMKAISAPKSTPVRDIFQVEVDYKIAGNADTQIVTATIHSGREDIDELDGNMWRLRFVKEVRQAHRLLAEGYGRNLAQAKGLLNVLSRDMRAWIDTQGLAMLPRKLEALVDLLRDLDGQVTEAIATPEYYNKWGKHYLPSLVRAHELQQANNFKDPGIQHYGGELFKNIRDAAEDIYLSLPPPKSTAPTPSTDYRSSSGSGSSSYSAPAAANIAYYHNRSAGCIHGASKMNLQSGKEVLARDLKKGDVLDDGNTIFCVWKTVLLINKAELCQLPGGLVVTPYHPVKFRNQWTFPRDIALPITISSDAVYSFLLQDKEGRFASSFTACGIEVIALCHGIEGDAVASHKFFGTSAIVDNLKQSKGWKDGLVVVHQKITGSGDIFSRDILTGLVNGIAIEDKVEEAEEEKEDFYYDYFLKNSKESRCSSGSSSCFNLLAANKAYDNVS